MNANDYLTEKFEKYVPSTGKADTLGGEIVRAITRLVYRNYNDGDHVGVGYGNETCNGSYRFLYNHIPNFPDLYGIEDDNIYDGRISSAENVVAQYLMKHEYLFHTPNKEDSREVLPEDLEREQEEFDDEDW